MPIRVKDIYQSVIAPLGPVLWFWATMRYTPFLMLVFGACVTACGARSELYAEPCPDSGTRICETACGLGEAACVNGEWLPCEVDVVQRSCSDACGEGTQQCEDGEWSACAVPPTEQICTNACGTGTQTCRAGLWSPCNVAPTQRACENICGAGMQTCTDDTWSPCAVPPTERPCNNLCGTGVETCQAGAWGRCTVPETERICTNLCGTGIETCRDGSWGTCSVPPTEFPCTNDCGAGAQSCIDGVLGTCSVEPTLLPCSNACGNGTQECVDNTRLECIVERAERACTTTCGDGIQACIDGTWLNCERPCTTVCGDGTQVCAGGDWSRCSTEPLPPVLNVRIRDFRDSHRDFESAIGVDRGIVETILGADDKPVYAGRPTTPTTNGRIVFDQWYRDVPGVNLGLNQSLLLMPQTGTENFFSYIDNDFFPIDGMLFGNEGRPHNFHFTLEAVTEFEYIGGEEFNFRGDDDVFVFINRRLVIDLGGVHGPQTARVDLDSVAAELGLVLGRRYPIHFFFAERHTTGSNFQLETTIADPLRCP